MRHVSRAPTPLRVALVDDYDVVVIGLAHPLDHCPAKHRRVRDPTFWPGGRCRRLGSPRDVPAGGGLRPVRSRLPVGRTVRFDRPKGEAASGYAAYRRKGVRFPATTRTPGGLPVHSGAFRRAADDEGSLVGPSIRPVAFTNPDEQRRDRTSTSLLDGRSDAFAADVALRRRAAVTRATAQRPYAAAAFAATPSDPPAWKTLPCWYAARHRGQGDPADAPAVHGRTGERNHRRGSELPTSHSCPPRSGPPCRPSTRQPQTGDPLTRPPAPSPIQPCSLHWRDDRSIIEVWKRTPAVRRALRQRPGRHTCFGRPATATETRHDREAPEVDPCPGNLLPARSTASGDSGDSRPKRRDCWRSSDLIALSKGHSCRSACPEYACGHTPDRVSSAYPDPSARRVRVRWQGV